VFYLLCLAGKTFYFLCLDAKKVAKKNQGEIEWVSVAMVAGSYDFAGDQRSDAGLSTLQPSSTHSCSGRCDSAGLLYS
jgi:hypothetical protein